MSKENDIVLVNTEIKNELSLRGEDIQRVADHLKIVKEAVKSIMAEGIDRDYGIIPGTKKNVLLKPGAEKLAKLFGLGARFKLTESDFDRFENFALYTYSCEIYHLKTGAILSQCEGVANSQEKKYREKAVYVNGVKKMEPVQVCDILNTLRKMAQKRAYVGAVILAVGASDYFSQDEEDIEALKPEKRASTVSAERFKNDLDDAEGFIPKIGKFKGLTLSNQETKDISNYVNYYTGKQVDGELAIVINKCREVLRKRNAA